MARLNWGVPGEHFYEAGVDQGVLYASGNPGVAWNGLVSVVEEPFSEPQSGYFDGVKHRNGVDLDSFQGAIKAFTYPDEFSEEDPFGLSYRTKILNELGVEEHKIHLVYNALVAPSPADYSSVDDSSDIVLFEWAFTTKPLHIPGLGVKPFAHLIIDTTSAYSSTIQELEDVIYGSSTVDASLPAPSVILEIFESNAILRITDNGDGTWTAVGPDSAIQMVTADEFQIIWPSAVYLNSTTYQISSL